MFVGHWELIVVGVVALLLFGHRLPKVMGALGEGVRNFRDAFSGRDENRDSGDSSVLA